MDRRLSPALLLTSVLIVVSVASPALIVSANGLETAAFTDWRMLLMFSAFVGFAFVLVGAVIFAASVKWLPDRYQLAPSVLFVGFVVCSSLFFPTIDADGILNPMSAPIDARNVAICASLAATLALLSMTRLAISGVVFIAVASVSAAMSYGPALFRSVTPEDGKSVFLTVGKANLFVVSFDGLSGDIVAQLIRENSEIAAAFSDFVLFTDAFSGAPATLGSMRSELFGVRNYHSFGVATEQGLQRYLEGHLAAGLPINLIPDSVTYGYSYSRRNLTLGDFSDGGSDYSLLMYRMLFESVVARVVTSKIFDLAQFRRVSVWVETVVAASVGEGSSSSMAMQIRNYKGVAPWDAVNLLAFDDFNNMVRGLRVGRSRFALRQMHFLHSHFPVDFDSSCRMRSTDVDWPKTVQNDYGLKEETKCWLNQIRAFKDRLVQLGIYDSSAIVFKSDHGAPASYFSRPPGNLKVRGHPLWGYDRYRPLLMIKGLYARKPRIELDGSPVGLPDLARTTCLLAGFGEQRCHAFPGLDLMSNIKSTLSRDVYLEVARSPTSSHQFDDHITVRTRLDSSRSLRQSMSEASLTVVQNDE